MSNWVIPLIVSAILLLGLFRNVAVYDVFLEGAKTGLKTAVDILPCLCAMLMAVGMLSASGALEALIGLVSHPLSALGVPPQALPVFLIRPFSGSGALAVLEETLKVSGADSLAGRTASVMAGASETIFYTFSVYLGAAGGKRGRYALPAALAAWMAGGLAAAWLCQIL